MAISGIPMPLSPWDSFSKGFGFNDNLMKQILERKQLKQKADQYKEDIALRKAQLELNKSAAGRASQAAADAHRIAMNKLDPTYEARQYEALENYFKSKGKTGGEQNGGAQMGGYGAPVTQQPMTQEPIPEQEMGQGMGMFSPQGFQDAQQRSSFIPPFETPQAQVQQQGAQQSNLSDPHLELMRKFPALRGLYKKHYGVDPFAQIPQTPKEKQAASLDLFREKEKIKAQNKGGDTPTNTVLTQNQQAIQGIDTVIPMLDELINDPDKVYGRWDFSPSKRAAYNAKTSGMIDTLVAAQSLPKVQASIDLVEQQIRRATNESDDSYIARIKDLRKDLMARRGKSQAVIQNRKVNTTAPEDFTKKSDEELMKIIGGG